MCGCRSRRVLREAEGVQLLLYRREDLAVRPVARSATLAVRWPTGLGEDLETLNMEASGAVETFAASRPGVDCEQVLFGIVDVPYGAVRRHLLARRSPPASVDDPILTTCRAVLPNG